MADVIAICIVVVIVPLRLMLLPIVYVILWLMLLPMYLWQMLWPLVTALEDHLLMAGVIAIYFVENVKPLRLMLLPILLYFWLMLLPSMCGRCYSHLLQYKVEADVIAKWQMEWPL